MANDFSGDTHCISVWRFESSPGFANDSKGSETLTAGGSPTVETIVIDEGSRSAWYRTTGPDYHYRLDSDLVSTFPCKNGTSNKTFSVFARVNWSINPGSGLRYIVASKYSGTNSSRCFRVDLLNNAGTMRIVFQLGNAAGTTATEYTHGGDFTALSNNWIRIGVSYNDSDQSYAIRVRNAAGSVLGTDLTGTHSSTIPVGTADWQLGSRGYTGTGADTLEGFLDEVCVFDDVLTDAEVTSLANGTYSAGSSVNTAVAGSAGTAGSGTSVPNFQIGL